MSLFAYLDWDVILLIHSKTLISQHYKILPNYAMVVNRLNTWLWVELTIPNNSVFRSPVAKCFKDNAAWAICNKSDFNRNGECTKLYM